MFSSGQLWADDDGEDFDFVGVAVWQSVKAQQILISIQPSSQTFELI